MQTALASCMFLWFLCSVSWDILPSTNLLDCADNSYVSLIFSFSPFSILYTCTILPASSNGTYQEIRPLKPRNTAAIWQFCSKSPNLQQNTNHFPQQKDILILLLLLLLLLLSSLLLLLLIKIHYMQGWAATNRHEVTRKKSTKSLAHTGNLFTKNLQLKDVC